MGAYDLEGVLLGHTKGGLVQYRMPRSTDPGYLPVINRFG
jgi:hypothetical protein